MTLSIKYIMEEFKCYICFDDNTYSIIRIAMKLGLIQKEDVVSFDDDLSVGDISNCKEYEYRKRVIYNIYHDNIAHIDDNEIKQQHDDFHKILLEENDFIIWYAHNPMDYCNLYYVVSLTKNKILI